MGPVAAYAALTAALGLGVWRVLEAPDRPSAARVATAALLLLAASQALSWCWSVRQPGLFELSTPPSLLYAAGRAVISAATAGAAFATLSPSLAGEGLLLGFLWALLGAQAGAWLRVFQAWRVMGSFAGTFFAPLTAPTLAVTCFLVAAASRLPELKPMRWKIVAAALLLWAVPVRVATWRLRGAHHWRGPSLSAEAGVPVGVAAERVSLAWLYPWAGRSVRFEERQAAVSGVDASPESLEKLDRYLRESDFDAVFARQALAVLRQGWLFWWEPDRALDAAMLNKVGRIAPEYKSALQLLRAGPIDEARYRRLQRLNEVAAPRTLGFEDVNTSQVIFEGFASAFARFGDESTARPWLLRIDRLWPIYDKKIEITGVETLHDGRIQGHLLLDGRAATGVKVGLFYIVSSTPTVQPSGWLSQSDFPDGEGRFSFEALAPGSYYIGLMGLPSDLRGNVLNPPGFIQLTAESPVVALDPIRIEN